MDSIENLQYEKITFQVEDTLNHNDVIPYIIVNPLFTNPTPSQSLREYNKLSEIITFSMKQIGILFTLYNREKYITDIPNVMDEVFKIKLDKEDNSLSLENFIILKNNLMTLEKNYNYIVSFYNDIKEFQNTIDFNFIDDTIELTSLDRREFTTRVHSENKKCLDLLLHKNNLKRKHNYSDGDGELSKKKPKKKNKNI